jgi:hypothetical protein
MFAAVWSPSSAAEPAERADYVAGKLIIFNDNGAWSWFQDERVIADPVAGTLLIGSVANRSGAGGMARDGNTEVAAYSWQSGALHVTALHERLEADDHNAPALMIRPDGHYLAVYAKHNGDRLTRWRVSADPHDATRWRDEQTFDWFQPPASIGKSTVTYSNVFNLSAESRTYDFARAVNRDPAFLVSTDDGSTWSYGGKLLTEQPLGYVNGYVKYASNNIDRIDFITTEHHPFYFNNSIYHGYIRGGKIHRSDGTVVDESIFDATAPAAADLTQVFAAGTVVDGAPMSRCWTTDLALGPEQHPYALFTCRANDVPENSHFDDHRFFYARFDGSTWNVHQLAKAGASLWSWERDYVGGGAVDPQDRSVVYISAAIDPRDAAKLAHHEIFRGATADGGSTWTWRPITRNSSVENLRPVVPQWYSGRTALVWCRGTMRNSQDYDMQIVGIIEPR